MVKIIDASKDLEIMNYLKEHTYVQTQSFFNISAQQIARVKKRNITNVPEAQPEPAPQPPAPQPEPEFPGVGSRTAADQENKETDNLKQKKKRREISTERVMAILTDETDHTNKYLKNLIVKGHEVILSHLLNKPVKISF